MSTDAAEDSVDPQADAVDTDGRLGLRQRDFRSYLQIGALGVAALFAVVSAIGFYTSARRVIQIWVARQFQPLFTAGFNLVVLLAMLAVVVALLDRLE